MNHVPNKFRIDPRPDATVRRERTYGSLKNATRAKKLRCT